MHEIQDPLHKTFIHQVAPIVDVDKYPHLRFIGKELVRLRHMAAESIYIYIYKYIISLLLPILLYAMLYATLAIHMHNY